mmetsp:Transcript_62469/g.140859  ORF Transcript_62469/g.140859 Transcript_62469/m.140859 type:complete len:191 (+) Transcript_62469:16-588(+)
MLLLVLLPGKGAQRHRGCRLPRLEWEAQSSKQILRSVTLAGVGREAELQEDAEECRRGEPPNGLTLCGKTYSAEGDCASFAFCSPDSGEAGVAGFRPGELADASACAPSPQACFSSWGAVTCSCLSSSLSVNVDMSLAVFTVMVRSGDIGDAGVDSSSLWTVPKCRGGHEAVLMTQAVDLTPANSLKVER